MKEKHKSPWYWFSGIVFLVGIFSFIYYLQRDNSTILDRTENHTAAVEAPVQPGQAAPEEEYPQFPWPPPSPTARYEIDAKMFGTLETENITLGEIDKRIIEALELSGYTQKSYFAVFDNGYALVTSLEQINQDGTAKEGKERFSDKVPPRKINSWEEYIKALFNPSAQGYFRIMVFIITDKPFSTSGGTPEYKTSVFWLNEGMNIIPPALVSIQFSDYQYTISTLIYEFEKPQNGDAIPIERGALTSIEYVKNLFASPKE